MLRVAEAAERLGLSRSKVYELVGEDKIPHYRLDGAIRFSDEQIAEYLRTTEKGRRPEAQAPTKKPRTPRPSLKHLRR